MGLYKIDNVSSEEWHRRQLRRHELKQWAITLLEIVALIGAVLFLMWLARWLCI